MSLPDEIFGVRQAPLKPLFGGNHKALQAIMIARSMVEDLQYDDDDAMTITTIVEWLNKAERELS